MKKLITKFISLVIVLSVLMSVIVLPVSATEEETEELITNFLGVPLDVKAKLYNDDGLKYKYNFIFRNSSGNYSVYFINDITDITDTNNIDDILYFDLTYSSLYFRKSENAVTKQSFIVLMFNSDGSYKNNSGGSTGSIGGYSGFYGYSSATDKVQNAVDNIIYSDFDVKYNGLTVYQTSNNKAVSIADIINLGAGDGTGEIVGPQQVAPMPGEYDFIGPLPLIKEEGNATFEGFKQWLIENEKYKELAQFGITCTVNNVSSLVDFWTGNYNSITDFYNALKTLFGNLNAGTQVKNIWNWLQNQWEEYKNSLITWETYPQIIPDGVTDIETDEDGNFISSELQYLKLILGVLMSVPQNTANFIHNNLNSVLTSISNNVYRIANYITSIPTAIYNNFVNSINLILEEINKVVTAIENIEITTPAEYTQECETVYGQIKDEISNKFDVSDSFSNVIETVKAGYLSSLETAPTFTIKAFNNGYISIDEDITFDLAVSDGVRSLIHGIILVLSYVAFSYRMLRRLPKIIGGI